MLFRPARASDMDEICALLATAHHPADYIYALLTADRNFDPAQVRIAWTGGHIVGCAKVYPRTMRLGAITTAVGGIGNVRTDPRYWQKGIASSLLSECLTALYVEGMTLAPLFAPRHTLFARRGWHAIPAVRLEIPAEALARVMPDEPPAQVRPFDPHDLDEVMVLHESVNEARSGSLVRDRDAWLSGLTALDLRGAIPLVAHVEDEITGYAVAQPRGDSVEVLELLLAPWSAGVWRPLLRGVLFRAGHGGALSVVAPADYRRLLMTPPPDAGAGDLPRPPRGARARGRRAGALPPGGSGALPAAGASDDPLSASQVRAAGTSDDLMLRMVEPALLLEEIAPLLALRLRDVDPVAPLIVRIGPLRGGAALHVEGRDVAVARPRTDDPFVLPEAVFLALLLGTEDAPARLDALGLPDAARQALLRLFPPQDWVFWRSDAF